MEKNTGASVVEFQTNFTDSIVENLNVENAEKIAVSSEHSEIQHVDVAVVIAEHAAVTVEDASISCEQCNFETSIIGSTVQDLDIRSAENVSVIAERTTIASNQATVQADEVSISAEQASFTAQEATISANVLQQTSVNETNITESFIGEIKTDNYHAENIVIYNTYAGEEANFFIKKLMAGANSPSLTEISSVQKKKYVANFKRDINRHSYHKSKGSVIDMYKDQRLVEPEFEVNPRVQELTHFFSGEMTPKVKEYRKETGFSVLNENSSGGNFVTMKDIFQSLYLEKFRHIAIVGQVGSGKTTSVKRLVSDVIEENNLRNNRASIDQLNTRYAIIYFVSIRDLLDSDSISAMELLFEKVISDLSDESVKYGYQWIIENQEKVVFFFDGMDQATWTLNEYHRKISHKEKASTATVMYNIVTGHLFSRVQIVTSSREHCVASLTGELRPQLTYALVGLSPGDVKKLFIALLDDIGQQQWDRMCSTSPSIISLSSVPVFLIYNVIVQKFNPESPPDSMTGVMLNILYILLQSQHVRDDQVLNKLKEIAFRAMSEGRVVFTKKELKRFGIDTNSIRDLVIKVPGRTLASHCLLDGTQEIYFSHQVIQEILAAMFVSEMEIGEFEEFMNKFHQDHWSVVLKFICGILLNPTLAIDWPPQMLQIGDKKKRKKY
ncbi:uncharacterized protein LOC144419823 [Styela clava]